MQFKRRVWEEQHGASMLMGVVLAIITLAAIAFNFLAETGQKQSGASVAYTSTNAFLIADAGVRYVEKCLKNHDSGCPIASSTDWKADFITTPATNFTKNFPTTATTGNFSVEFIQNAINDKDNIRIRSTGTYKGAIRTIGSTVSRFATCVLGQQAISYCSTGSIKNSASTDDPNSPVASCPAVSVDLLYPSEFPDDPTTCPNTEYPDYANGSPTMASPYQYCSWSLSGTNSDSIGAFSYVASGGAASGQAVVKVKDADDFVAGMKVRLTRGSSFTSAASAGATTVTIADTTGFAANQIVKFIDVSSLGSVLPAIEEVQISSVDSSTQLTLSSALINSYASGDVADLTDASTSATKEELTISNVNTGTDELTLTGNLANSYLEGSSVESVITMWAAKDFSLKDSSVFKVKGVLRLNIGGNAVLEDVSELQIFGSLDFHLDQDFTLKNSAKMNEVMGFPADLLVQAGDDAAFKNSTNFRGGIIANDTVNVNNNGNIIGSISGDSVVLRNNSNLEYDPNAGSDSESIGNCVPSTFNPPSQSE